MPEPKALVLDGHSRAAVETVQSLGRAGVIVDVASEEAPCLAFRSRYARRRLQQPPSADPVGLSRWVLQIDREAGYSLVVPSTEASLAAFRALPESDALRARAILPSDHALDTALDKHRTLELARRLGIPTPTSTLIRTSAEAAIPSPCPLVLKPVQSKIQLGGRPLTLRARLAVDETARRRELRALLPHTAVLQQEWVPGRGVGVELLYERGRKRWHFLHERLHELPLTGGGSSYRRSIPVRPPLLESSVRLLDALAWHGVAMVEFREQQDGPFALMAITPGLWESLALAEDAGVHFPRGLLALAMGEGLAPQPAYDECYYTRSLEDDVEWFGANAIADRADPFLLTRPLLPSLLETLRPLIGRESWDHFDATDPGVILGVVSGIVRRHARALKKLWLRRRRLARLGRRHRRIWGGVMPPVKHVLFVCVGNICRSPFAEALARREIPTVEVTSVGLDAREGRPSPPAMQEVARSMGIDLGRWSSKRARPSHVASADLILAMDLEVVDRLVAEFPEAAPRTTLLGYFGGGPPEITDPYGRSETETRRVLERIDASVRRLAILLQATEHPTPQPPPDW
jgi:protein-tyrosine-phosphatase/predicted ATP-grasp superfamily ATP-dependent carboligase